MSAPVDVLAVMDDQIGVIYPSRSPEEAAWHKRVVEARAAMAELIEAGNKVGERCWTHMGNESLYEMQDLRKAIARVSGVK